MAAPIRGLGEALPVHEAPAADEGEYVSEEEMVKRNSHAVLERMKALYNDGILQRPLGRKLFVDHIKEIIYNNIVVSESDDDEDGASSEGENSSDGTPASRSSSPSEEPVSSESPSSFDSEDGVRSGCADYGDCETNSQSARRDEAQNRYEMRRDELERKKSLSCELDLSIFSELDGAVDGLLQVAHDPLSRVDVYKQVFYLILEIQDEKVFKVYLHDEVEAYLRSMVLLRKKVASEKLSEELDQWIDEFVAAKNLTDRFWEIYARV